MWIIKELSVRWGEWVVDGGGGGTDWLKTELLSLCSQHQKGCLNCTGSNSCCLECAAGMDMTLCCLLKQIRDYFLFISMDAMIAFTQRPTETSWSTSHTVYYFDIHPRVKRKTKTLVFAKVGSCSKETGCLQSTFWKLKLHICRWRSLWI